MGRTSVHASVYSDKLDWEKLMNALIKTVVNWKDRILVGNLYIGQKV